MVAKRRRRKLAERLPKAIRHVAGEHSGRAWLERIRRTCPGFATEHADEAMKALEGGNVDEALYQGMLASAHQMKQALGRYLELAAKQLQGAR